MFKDYDDLRQKVENLGDKKSSILKEKILEMIEFARECGFNDGEDYGFKQALNQDFNGMDIDDLPDELIDEIETNAYDRGRDDGYHSGFDDGREEGYDAGHDDGHASGYDEGYNAGHDDGYDECKVELGVD